MTQALIVYLRSHRVVFQQVFLVNLSHPCFYIINQTIISKRCVSFLTHRTPWETDASYIWHFTRLFWYQHSHLNQIYRQAVFVYFLLLYFSTYYSYGLRVAETIPYYPVFCVIICLRSSTLYLYVTSVFMTISGRIN